MTNNRTAGKLGRLPHDPDRLALHLGPHLTGVIPPNPPLVDWLSRVSDWPMYGNDRYGDCVWAMIGHLIEAWTTYGQGKTVTVDEAALLKGYSAVTGFNPADPSTDRGTVIADALSYWRKTGIAGHKILAYAQVDHTNRAEVDAALSIFGGLCLGVRFPASAMDQFNTHQAWHVVNPDGGIEGGHAVHHGYYQTSAQDERVVTWGAVQTMTDDWWNRYVEEAWVVITPEWLSAAGTSPGGVDLQGLGDDFARLTGQANPFPAPQPAPTPVDVADRRLVTDLEVWLRQHHVGYNHQAQLAVERWRVAKGL
jgi:hypothetical protein